MTKQTGNFTIRIPKGFPGYVEKNPTVENGGKLKKEYTWDKRDNQSEADAWLSEETVKETDEQGNKTERPKTYVDLVNEVIEARAKANQYQIANSAYVESDLSRDQQIQKLIKDFMVFGKMSESDARNLAESTVANAEKSK